MFKLRSINNPMINKSYRSISVSNPATIAFLRKSRLFHRRPLNGFRQLAWASCRIAGGNARTIRIILDFKIMIFSCQYTQTVVVNLRIQAMSIGI